MKRKSILMTKTYWVLLLCMSLSNWMLGQTNFGAVQYNPFGVTSVPFVGSPNLVDIDNDGDLDLFYGDPVGSGGIAYYVNTGTNTNPTFGTAVSNPFNLNSSLPFGLLTPEYLDFVDLDNDGDLDLFIMDIDQFSGTPEVLYFQNTGTATAASFASPISNPFGLAPSIGIATYPSFVDIDNDNDQDLFIGYSSGNTLFFRNTGSSTNPSFSAPLVNPFGITNTFLGSGLTASFADLDGDGDLDLLADNEEGTFKYYQNTGNVTNPTFAAAVDNPFNLTSIFPLENTPHLADIDGDGDADLFASNGLDTLFFFENISPTNTVTCNFSTNNLTVNETAGNATITLNISGTLAVNTTVDVVLNGGGTATNGVDFSFTSPTTVTFPAGSNASQTITIPITNDALSEYFEYFELSLANATSGLQIGNTNNLEIEIDDDDFVPPVLAFSPNTMTVNEGGGSVTATVTLSAAIPVPVIADVLLKTTSTATNGSDFSYTSPSNITFLPGITSQTITIPITDDNNIEGNETIVLEFDQFSILGPVNPNATPLTITIVDNDALTPTVSFTGTTITIGESIGTISVNLNIINPNNSPTSVDVLLKGTSTASNGTDFTFTSPTTVTFPANSSGVQTIVIPILDDAIIENTERIELELSNPTNNALIGGGTYRINISDDDTPPIYVSFDTASMTVNEGVGTITVDVTITNPNSSPTRIEVLSSLTSTATYLDFIGGIVGSISQTIIFPANSTTPKTITIPIKDDNNDEGLETLVLELLYPTNGAIVSPNASVSINIVDNDGAPSLAFSSTTTTISELAGGKFIEVALSGSNTGTVLADVAIGPNTTATEGVDFSIGAIFPITFIPGFPTQVFFLTILDDADTEGNEVIELILTSPSGTPISQGTTTIIIDDNETISVNKIAAAESVKLYPIPTQDKLWIELGEVDYTVENIAVEVVNSAGQIVKNTQLPYQPTLELPLEDLQDGFYLLVLRKNNVELPLTKKFVIQR